jgi:spore maturation protein CgeB
MKLVIFGLTVSSSWGNGHATLWRGLLNALARDSHRCIFFERNVPWYESTRDLTAPSNFELVLYPSWDEIRERAAAELADTDAAIVTSFCPDAPAAAEVVLESRATRVFYDLDAPVTLARMDADLPVEWVGEGGYSGYDLVLSYSGGRSLEELRTRLGARRVAPLFGSVDLAVHHPVKPMTTPAGNRRIDLSYLGTWAEDRQRALEKLLIEPARQKSDRVFLIGGSMYPANFPWGSNIYFIPHVAPADHNAFYCSSDLTLNITRKAMRERGYCPSGRLFEAAACETPVLSDWWPGVDEFFEPDREILIARNSDDVLRALALDRAELKKIGHAASERARACHTAGIRARQMVEAIESAASDRLAQPAGVSGGNA